MVGTAGRDNHPESKASGIVKPGNLGYMQVDLSQDHKEAWGWFTIAPRRDVITNSTHF